MFRVVLDLTTFRNTKKVVLHDANKEVEYPSAPKADENLLRDLFPDFYDQGKNND